MNVDKPLFGRNEERQILFDYANSNTSAFVALVGRRRIGKTYLVRRVFEKKIDLEVTGLQYATKSEQIENFVISLSTHIDIDKLSKYPTSWLEIFHLIKKILAKKSKVKKIIFIDELPWINTKKSGFIESLAHFWNDWASENNVLLIVSGSATSWMLKHIVNGRGGLHNRINQTLFLEPFTLNETKQMLDGMKIKHTSHQLLELYMIIGGVPYYLSLLQRSKSIDQNIDQLLFNRKGKLHNEYENLFPSLFDNPQNYTQVIEAILSKWKGLTRTEILKSYKGTDGGRLTEILKELELSGFISKYKPYNKTAKESLFRVSDPYIMFYKKFIFKKPETSFLTLSKKQEFKSWCGYAFENLCLCHIDKIKEKLGIAKIESDASSYFFKGNSHMPGFQIDLIIDRADNIINICEIKYYSSPYYLDKKTYLYLKTKMDQFVITSKTKKKIHLTLVTSLGFMKNEYSMEIIDSEVLGEDLIGIR